MEEDKFNDVFTESSSTSPDERYLYFSVFGPSSASVPSDWEMTESGTTVDATGSTIFRTRWTKMGGWETPRTWMAAGTIGTLAPDEDIDALAIQTSAGRSGAPPLPYILFSTAPLKWPVGLTDRTNQLTIWLPSIPLFGDYEVVGIDIGTEITGITNNVTSACGSDPGVAQVPGDNVAADNLFAHPSEYCGPDPANLHYRDAITGATFGPFNPMSPPGDPLSTSGFHRGTHYELWVTSSGPPLAAGVALAYALFSPPPMTLSNPPWMVTPNQCSYAPFFLPMGERRSSHRLRWLFPVPERGIPIDVYFYPLVMLDDGSGMVVSSNHVLVTLR